MRDVWARVDRSAGADGCWPWIGPVDQKGYGRMSRGQRVTRLVLQDALGRVLAPGEMACHHCDNPPCCNPAHLYAGNNATNMRDRYERGRRSPITEARSQCSRGHELSGHNLEITSSGRRCRACRRDRVNRDRSSPEVREARAVVERERYRRRRLVGASTPPNQEGTPRPLPHDPKSVGPGSGMSALAAETVGRG